jgi:hypothetical protein
MWTYAMLGILAVITIYLGIAVADSLQSGGRDSGAVPLDSPPSSSDAEAIDCDVPIVLQAGTPPQEVTFDETALDGFTMSDVTVLALSADSNEADLVATRLSPFAMRLEAAEQAPTRAHTDAFELRIQWQRGDEAAQSSCNVQVNVPGEG